MKYCTVNKNYMTYLRKYDSRVPFTDYGENHYKPCLFPLFKVDDLVYVVHITSPKAKHRHMGNSQDFKKIFIDTNKRKGRYYVGAINLNHMVPVPKEYLQKLDYRNIEKIREFKNDKARSKYISLLKHELKSVNEMHIDNVARKLYEFKNLKPESAVAKRCLDFKKLEKAAKLFNE